MSRRRFLSASGAAALLTAGCSQTDRQATLNVFTEWTEPELESLRERLPGFEVAAIRPTSFTRISDEVIDGSDADFALLETNILGAAPSRVLGVSLPGLAFRSSDTELPIESSRSIPLDRLGNEEWLKRLAISDFTRDSA